ncbi:MAG TPA: hypothetical protein VGN23_01080 [Verrucomicrobiae bacterium]|jgi:hypothetical protein
MKTPREILLERHKAAIPQLDALRNQTINAELRRKPSTVIVDWLSLLWRELIWPCRGIWTGLATVWILIFAANIAMNGGSHPVMAKVAASQGAIVAWQQQQRLLSELTGMDDAHIALPTRPFSPRPSSQRQFNELVT